MLTSKRKDSLRAKLKRNLPGLDNLKPEDQRKVQQMLGKKWMQKIRRDMRPVAISKPVEVPWKFNRCGRIYKQRLAWAQQHAQSNQCKPKRRTRRATPQHTNQSTHNTYGHRRLLSWRANIHRILRQEQSISTQPFQGCRSCFLRKRRRKKKATRVHLIRQGFGVLSLSADK